MPDSYVKDPDANKPYGVDWSAWLAAGDTITTSTWLVPAGLVAGDEDVTDGQTTVWLSGGTLGNDYLVTNRIVTAQGMVDDWTIRILVRNR